MIAFIVPALGFLAGLFGVGAWAHSRNKKNTQVPRTTISHVPSPPPWPEGLRKTTLKELFSRWFPFWVDEMTSSQQESPPSVEVRESPPPSASQRIAKVVNLLDWPLFIAGAVLLPWLIVDFVLEQTLLADTYASIAVWAVPAVAILGPAAAGYWTNWLALKMLFHPRQPNAVWQGLIPARRNDLVESMAEGVLDRLISPEIVREYLRDSRVLQALVGKSVAATRVVVDDPDFRSEVKGLVYGIVEDLATRPETAKGVGEAVAHKIDTWTGTSFGEKIVGWFRGLWGPPLQRALVTALPEIPQAIHGALDHLDRELAKVPDYVEENGEAIEDVLTRLIVEGLHQLDIKGIVQKQFEKMDESELEDLLTGNVSDELRFIQVAGGVLGLAVGLAIQFPWVRIGLLGVGLGLFLLYRFTVEKAAHPGESL